ncbi:MAG: DinB family protein [Planctomycetota bacterium]
MPNRVPWTERTFNFDYPVDLYPELLERLLGTPARAEHVARSVPPYVLARRDGETWSIQENLGHLADVEALFDGRLDDFDAGAETLRPADMTNRVTHGADHNARPIASVLSDLRDRRERLVARLDALAPNDFGRRALHPRLNKPMRVVDMMLFQAEHDDYHFARIRELIRLFT